MTQSRQKTSFRSYGSLISPWMIAGMLLTISLIHPVGTLAQQSGTFYQVSYYKVQPGKEPQFRNLMKTFNARIQQARLAAGAISGWYVYKVLSPSGSGTEYDYVSVAIIRRYKDLFDPSFSYDSATKAAFPGKDAKSLEDYYSKATETGRLVKEENYVGLALADSGARDGFRSKYAVVDFMQPKPDKFGEYLKMETDTFRVIHKERVKLGDISQWACLQLALPYDLKIGYSILDFNFYSELENMLASKYMEALKTASPKADLNNLFQSVGAMRDNPKADLLQLFTFVAQ